MAETNTNPQSLRILSIDGGGIKGLTALLVLKRLMRSLMVEAKLTEEPRPCETFDLIGGNSTGGLIAIMLGRLGMTADECIQAYEDIGQMVFGQKVPGGIAGWFRKKKSSGPLYSVDQFQSAIKRVLETKKVDNDSPFDEYSTGGCRTFITVTRSSDVKPQVIRNYISENADQEKIQCTIWEAGSATVAAAPYFGGVTFRTSKSGFTTGRWTCPIYQAIAEARNIIPNQDLGCVVSLGTGWIPTSEMPKKADKSLQNYIDMHTDADRIAESFRTDKLGQKLLASNGLFRFSVKHSMAQLKLDEWAKERDMRDLTDTYLQRPEQAANVRSCAQSLLDPQGVSS